MYADADMDMMFAHSDVAGHCRRCFGRGLALLYI